DKNGKRFGFARFEDVGDSQQLLEKLEDTWLGSYKIRANSPKFARGEAPKDNAANGGRVIQNERKVIPDAKLQVASYKQVITGANTTTEIQKARQKFVPNTKQKRRLTEEEYRAGIQEIQPDPELLTNLQNCYVGTLWETVEAEILQVSMWMEGYQQIKVTTLGMDLVLLSSTVIGQIQEGFQKNKRWWERWFSKIQPWRPDILPKGRRIWVRLFGVPLHIWNWEGFEKIIWRFGKLQNLDPETLNQTRFDVARAHIQISSWEMVDEVIEIKVNEEIFIIRMVEERFGSIDLGLNKTAASAKVGGGSDDGSAPNRAHGGSVLGVDEGWSEANSDGASVECDEDRCSEDLVVIDQVHKTSDREAGGQLEREIQSSMVTVTGETNVKGSEKAEEEGEKVGTEDTEHVVPATQLSQSPAAREETYSADLGVRLQNEDLFQKVPDIPSLMGEVEGGPGGVDLVTCNDVPKEGQIRDCVKGKGVVEKEREKTKEEVQQRDG
ncbi:hypothetical protein A2U01_0005144, partial [Trifolium medium]|nr:hypothetical protein [Trifolium medium]